MDPTLVRRIVGTASAVLVIALSAVVLEARYAPPAGSYEVVAELGRAGSGVRQGTDVKVRGVAVGRVAETMYEDGVALARLTLNPEPRLPVADQIDLVVTPKTLLGEKQIDLSFPEGSLGEGPFLQAGDRLVASRSPTEITEAIDALEPFLRAVDPQDLATIVDTLGDQRGEGEVIAENIELGQELANFGARTAPDTLDRFRAFTDVSDALTLAVPDLTRMNTALPEATAVLVERQADLRRNLDTLSRFSNNFVEQLEVQEPVISRFLRTSQPVGEVLVRQQDQIGELLNGIFMYSRALGSGGILLDDGSEWGAFRIFIDEDSFDPVKLLCHEFDVVGLPQPPALCDEVDA
ncbi:MCE family protein [Nitriliruptor alkaliphilus]|uniref:MCE family protein n=1 Tax=Nitriliruptor alkaliphilus TaxID=427918 RepID=UPI0012EE02D8|nr:MCE family protein [Nitriliruptor alkaliphilus]